MNTIDKIRAEIKRLEEIHERNLKKPMERGRIGFAHGVVECCDRILSFIDSLPEEPTPKGYDEAYLNECIAKASKTWEGVDVDKYVDEVRGNRPMNSDNSLEDEMINYWGRIPDDKDLIDTARHFALWQEEQDRSRKEANIKLANTDVPVDFDMEIAFHDIWEDVEVIIERDGKLDTKLTEDMKALCHDFFESGKEWQKAQMMDEWLKDRDGCFWDGVEEGKKAMEEQGQTKEGEVIEDGEFIKFSDGTYIDLCPDLSKESFAFKTGEKVIVQIRKA